MSDTETPQADAGYSTGHGGGRHPAIVKMAIGAIGVAFGDIGTSPIYAFRETFTGHHKLTLDDFHVMGVVSLIFWTMTIVVSIKYVGLLLRADNKGQGGSLALVALISRYIGRSKYGWLAVLLGVLATSLFYGDSMITPTMTVLSDGLASLRSKLSAALESEPAKS